MNGVIYKKEKNNKANSELKVINSISVPHSNEDVYKMVRAGLLDKMSFAFTVAKQTWDRSGKIPIRRIESINRLYDVSVVDTPA